MKRLGSHLLLLAILSGLSVAQNAPVELLRALKVEQQEKQLVLGEHYGGEFHFIDSTISSKGFRTTSQYARVASGRTLTLKDGAESQTTDGEWSASCKHRKTCMITSKHDASKKFEVKLKNLLTPVYWSPDGKFMFYIVRAPAFRLPMRCGFDDERDVIVHEINSGLNGVLTTVCGASYVDLRWYEFDKPLPLSPELIKR